MGIERSCDGAYRQHKGYGSDTTKRAPSTWRGWHSLYRWRERAEAYDRWINETARRQKEDDHRQLIEDHSKRSLQLARSMFATSVRALALAAKRLESMEASDLDPKACAAMLRSAAALGRSAIETEQEALGIETLVGAMSGEEE